MRRTEKVLALLGIGVFLGLSSVGCCCWFPPYRSSPYYCSPATSCYQPPACSTASNDRLVPKPMTDSGTLNR